MKKIQLNTKTKAQKVRIRIIKAPLVNPNDLRFVMMSRAKAIVL